MPPHASSCSMRYLPSRSSPILASGAAMASKSVASEERAVTAGTWLRAARGGARVYACVRRRFDTLAPRKSPEYVVRQRHALSASVLRSVGSESSDDAHTPRRLEPVRRHERLFGAARGSTACAGFGARL